MATFAGVTQANHLRRVYCGRSLFSPQLGWLGIDYARLWELEGWTDVRERHGTSSTRQKELRGELGGE